MSLRDTLIKTDEYVYSTDYVRVANPVKFIEGGEEGLIIAARKNYDNNYYDFVTIHPMGFTRQNGIDLDESTRYHFTSEMYMERVLQDSCIMTL